MLQLIPVTNHVYKTRTCDFVWADGFIRIMYHPDTDISEAEAWEHVGILQEMTGKKPTPTIIDLRAPAIRAHKLEVRNIYAGPHSKEYMACLALLIRSPMSSLIGNLFIRISRPPYPTKLFTSEPDAIAWATGHPVPKTGT